MAFIEPVDAPRPEASMTEPNDEDRLFVLRSYIDSFDEKELSDDNLLSFYQLMRNASEKADWEIYHRKIKHQF